ncbi:hypothetical protein NEIMUCOT_03574 [Neisseria mucosa ATCC 25996]|uniref:Uncharacterized protein n=1 Tax=Neisseria mucosa (strain ATCC 25996 / DSM 4631 / NCTC 10774 / M26) TaxID=546266 RepID=D2ZSJ2_NEIM2|nr:hypothetical protein NEIMUCOT_03574 [Neisseria mucosa ATCC 25996]
MNQRIAIAIKPERTMTVSKQRSSENGQQVSLKRFQTTFQVTTAS